MEDYGNKLKRLGEAQGRLADELQELLAEYRADDAVRENEELRGRVSQYEERMAGLETRLREAEKQRAALKQALTEQMLDEKLGMIGSSKQKLHTYFAASESKHEGRLQELERRAQDQLRQLHEQAGRILAADKEGLMARIGELQAETDRRMAAHREAVRLEAQRIRAGTDDSYDALSAEGINEETLRKRMKQNRLEMKIGLSWISKLGILLLLIGMGAFFRHTYLNWLNDGMKAAGFFLLGLLMMAGGEWLFRRRLQVFALSLLGGGISILYGSVFYSYFLLEIFNLFAALVASVAITAAAVALSLRYNSRTICSFGLVGGYLPFFSYLIIYGLDGTAVYAAMGYLLLLNGLVLLISLRKRWPVVQSLSFGLHALALVPLVFLAEREAVGMLYAVAAFAMYLLVTLYMPFKQSIRLTWREFTVLALNTALNCAVLYGLLDAAGWERLNGLLALAFAVVYLGLAYLAQKHVPEETATRILFYGTAVTFSLLVIPFQYGIAYLTTAWMVEAVVLAVLGHLYGAKAVERTGWIIAALCAGAYLFIDTVLGVFLFTETPSASAWRYRFVSLGLLGLAVFYAFRLREGEKAARYGRRDLLSLDVLKYGALLNGWVYVLFEASRLYNELMPSGAARHDFFEALLLSVMTIGWAYVVDAVKPLRDRWVELGVRIVYGIGYLFSLAVTFNMPAMNPEGTPNTGENVAALLILIALNALILASARSLIRSWMWARPDLREWYPVVMGAYLFAVLTAFLGVQLQLGHISWLFSLAYLLLAIGYIVYGFRRRTLLIRHIGLGLTLFSTGKMLLFDLNLMASGSKIAAYFIFGVLLLGISYLYQKASNLAAAEDETEETEETEQAERTE